MEKIVIAVLGKVRSGKSSTWNSLFGRPVKTGKKEHRLYLSDAEYVSVFLVSGSPEEREKYVGNLITVEDPKIVLCSIQYRIDSKKTIEYFLDKRYAIYVQWLNPGYSDENEYEDNENLIKYLLDKGAVISKRNGKESWGDRVREIRDFIYGWSQTRNLINVEYRNF